MGQTNEPPLRSARGVGEPRFFFPRRRRRPIPRRRRWQFAPRAPAVPRAVAQVTAPPPRPHPARPTARCSAAATAGAPRGPRRSRALPPPDRQPSTAAVRHTQRRNQPATSSAQRRHRSTARPGASPAAGHRAPWLSAARGAPYMDGGGAPAAPYRNRAWRGAPGGCPYAPTATQSSWSTARNM